MTGTPKKPTTVHGAPIYSDPPKIRMRPRGAVGMAWWEECAPGDPEGVDYIPAATLAAVEAERDAAQRQIDILAVLLAAVHRRNGALAARLKEAEEALAEGIDVLNNLSSSIQVHGNYSSESTLTFLGQAIAACEDAAAALRPTDDRREPGTGGGDE